MAASIDAMPMTPVQEGYKMPAEWHRSIAIVHEGSRTGVIITGPDDADYSLFTVALLIDTDVRSCSSMRECTSF